MRNQFWRRGVYMSHETLKFQNWNSEAFIVKFEAITLPVHIIVNFFTGFTSYLNGDNI